MLENNEPIAEKQAMARFLPDFGDAEQPDAEQPDEYAVTQVVYRNRPAAGRFYGILLLLLSALCWSISLVTAFMVSREGITVNTSNTSRFLLATFVLLSYQLLRKRPLRLSRDGQRYALTLGICGFFISFGYLTATQYIPVSLAVLLFYTAPFFVALMVRFIEHRELSNRKIAALALAFTGLSLALNLSEDFHLSLIGISFALLAGVSLAILILLSARKGHLYDSVAVNIHVLGIASVLFILVLVLSGDLTVPQSSATWGKLGVVGVAVAVAQLSMFIGVRYTGALLGAMLMNFEPLFTVSLAILLIGEQLSALQMFGALLVISAVFMISWPSRSAT